MSLDVLTPKGRETLEQERSAVALFQTRFPKLRFIHTDKETGAKADGLVIKGDQLRCVVLTSCRKDCTYETLTGPWENEWLVTWRKLALGAWIAKRLEATLLGFLYFVEEERLLVVTLWKGRWVAEFRTEYTWTQATVNGGRVKRNNAFIKMDNVINIQRAPLVH